MSVTERWFLHLKFPRAWTMSKGCAYHLSHPDIFIMGSRRGAGLLRVIQSPAQDDQKGVLFERKMGTDAQ